MVLCLLPEYAVLHLFLCDSVPWHNYVLVEWMLLHVLGLKILPTQ